MIASVTELPFNRLMGLERGDAASVLTLPSGGQYLNHLGTVHAGALLALAEAASGEHLLQHFRGAEGVIPVVRRMEAKFRKPAHGSVSSAVTIADGEPDRMQRELAAKGRTLIDLAVELYDQSATHVLSAKVEWFITTQP
jgi:acyl-coenzyme A thioesterase PaaI-like protein